MTTQRELQRRATEEEKVNYLFTRDQIWERILMAFFTTTQTNGIAPSETLQEYKRIFENEFIEMSTMFLCISDPEVYEGKQRYALGGQFGSFCDKCFDYKKTDDETKKD